ncbi:hypothetical protein GGU11DRAFT_749605 [Lentinula aff. detonsa]|nr:hypothetical protein GGU11DRAFT_749605 [Lentinula aff. detonsa]
MVWESDNCPAFTGTNGLAVVLRLPMSRPTIRKRKHDAHATPSAPSSPTKSSLTKRSNYALTPLTPRRRNPRAQALVFLPDDQMLTQRHSLPHPVGQHGLRERPLDETPLASKTLTSFEEDAVFNKLPQSRHNHKQLM